MFVFWFQNNDKVSLVVGRKKLSNRKISTEAFDEVDCSHVAVLGSAASIKADNNGLTISHVRSVV
jgi:hypothetical protein